MPRRGLITLDDLPPDWQAQAARQMGKPVPCRPESRLAGGELVLTIPLPPSACSPNARVHWAALKRARDRQRQWVVKALVGVTGRRWVRASVRLRFFHAARRKRDSDNATASVKAVLDQLQDSGIVEDDSGLTHWPVEFLIDRDRPRLEVTVTEIVEF